MTRLAAIGTNEFLLGFQLAGIKDTIEADKNGIFKALNEIKKNKEIGIVVVDQTLMDAVERHDRIEIESSVHPVFVSLSTKSSQDNLRYLIKKSIGVDLLQQ